MALPLQKRSKPLAVGEELDSEVKKYTTALRQAGTPVSVKLVLATAEGIITTKERSLLVENGGHISLTRRWTHSLFKRMGYVKQKANTKTNTQQSDHKFQERKLKYLNEISGKHPRRNCYELGPDWLEPGA